MQCGFNPEVECGCLLQPAAEYFHGVAGLAQLKVLGKLIEMALQEGRYLNAGEISALANLNKTPVDKKIAKGEFYQLVVALGKMPTICPNFDPQNFIPPGHG